MNTSDWIATAEALYGPGWRRPLAKALAVNRNTVQRWERGEQPLPSAVLAWLLNAAPPRREEK